MKKIFISMMMAAAMMAATSCACSSNSEKKAEENVECTADKCAGCDKKDSCGDSKAVPSECSKEECAGCDSTSVKDTCCRR